MEEEKKQEEPFRFSCSPAFEALWFCYSPVCQLKIYYREGTFDTCAGKWSDLFECFKLKTKKASEAKRIIESRQVGGPQFWELRTKEESTKFWNEQFGDRSETE